MSRRPHRLSHALHRVAAEAVTIAFVVWVLQLMGWLAMMVYVQFVNPKLGDNVLYVTQISHWALVITCGTAATATWALVQAKHNAHKLEQIRRTEEQQEETLDEIQGDR